MRARNRRSKSRIERGSWALLTGAALVCALLVPGADTALAAKQPKKLTTYRVTLTLDSKLDAAPISGTGVTTANVVARPRGSEDDPTAFEGTGPITVDNERYAGIPLCTATKSPTTGTLHVAVVKSGGQIEVTWAAEVSVPPLTIACAGGARMAPSTAIQPFLLTEPRTFTLPEGGGSKEINGGMQALTNKGTITVVKREECDPKVAKVTTHPPGQATKLTSQAGHGLGVGEKLTADTNVELTFADGSIARLAKGASLKQDDRCGAFDDTSPSYKGTLLLGKIWYRISTALGGSGPTWDMPNAGGGVRGTVFSVDATKARTIVSVTKGSFWLRRRANGRLTGPTVIVKAGRTATATRTRITVRRSRPGDAFAWAK